MMIFFHLFCIDWRIYFLFVRNGKKIRQKKKTHWYKNIQLKSTCDHDNSAFTTKKYSKEHSTQEAIETRTHMYR